MSRVFDVEVRMRRHARLLGDVLGMTAWFAAHGRTSISDGSGRHKTAACWLLGRLAAI